MSGESEKGSGNRDRRDAWQAEVRVQGREAVVKVKEFAVTFAQGKALPAAQHHLHLVRSVPVRIVTLSLQPSQQVDCARIHREGAGFRVYGLAGGRIRNGHTAAFR